MRSKTADGFLFVTQYFPPEMGAAQVRLGAVTRQVQRNGHRVEVVTAVPNYPTGRIFPGWSKRLVQRRDEEGILVRRVWVWAAVGSGWKRLANYFSFGLTSMLGVVLAREARWTVVEYPTLFGALPAVAWCRLRRRAVAVIVADLWVDTLVAVGALPEGRVSNVLLAAEGWLLRSADAVSVVTDGVRDAVVAKGVDPSRVCWLPNGVDTSLFSPGSPDPRDLEELDLKPGEHLFVYAGTQGYVHGLEVLLDAGEELAGEPIRFLVVGGGSESQRLRDEAEQRDLRSILFWEPVSPERVAGLLRLASAGLASTRRGELYRSIRSAKMFPVMATGKPVLYAGDDEGARLIAEAGAGIQVPAGDAVALAVAIRRIVADPDEAERLGRQGRAYVLRHSSWSSIVDQWLEELDRVDRHVSRQRRSRNAAS